MRILYFSSSFGSPTTTFIRNETEAFSKTDKIKYISNSLYTGFIQPEYVEVIPFRENLLIKKLNGGYGNWI
jgi:hypothetical protein